MRETLDITWEELYKYWEYTIWNAPSILKIPIDVVEIKIDYNRKGFFYGYDWITHKSLENRKRMIETDVTQFLCFAEPSNKGTIHTMQMLVEAETDEEIAAIWMYAVAFELLENGLCGKSRKYADQICRVTRNFLYDRFCLWHHAMRKLVPEIYTKYLIRESEYESFESIIELIALNVALIRYEYVSVLYSSLEKGERCSECSIRL